MARAGQGRVRLPALPGGNLSPSKAPASTSVATAASATSPPSVLRRTTHVAMPSVDDTLRALSDEAAAAAVELQALESHLESGGVVHHGKLESAAAAAGHGRRRRRRRARKATQDVAGDVIVEAPCGDALSASESQLDTGGATAGEDSNDDAGSDSASQPEMETAGDGTPGMIDPADAETADAVDAADAAAAAAAAAATAKKRAARRHPLFNLQAALERAAMRRTQCTLGTQTARTLVEDLEHLRHGLAASQAETKALRIELRRLRAQTTVELARGRIEVAQGLVQRIVAERTEATRERRAQLLVLEQASRAQLAAEVAACTGRDALEAQRIREAATTERETTLDSHATELLTWKRQCFYYKTEVAELRQHNAQLTAAVARHNIQLGNAEPDGAFKVIDDVAVTAELAACKEKLAATAVELEDTRLRLRAAQLEAGEGRQLYAQGQRMIVQKDTEMAEERTRLEERIDALERRFFGRASEQEMAVRAQLRADIESKLRFELRQEYKVALLREQKAQQALRDKMTEMLAAADKKHMAAVAALRKEHQQIMARHTAEHRAEIAELNVSWQRKVMVTQEGINKLQDTEATRALAARQERLLALLARVRPADTPGLPALVPHSPS